MMPENKKFRTIIVRKAVSLYLNKSDTGSYRPLWNDDGVSLPSRDARHFGQHFSPTQMTYHKVECCCHCTIKVVWKVCFWNYARLCRTGSEQMQDCSREGQHASCRNEEEYSDLTDDLDDDRHKVTYTLVHPELKQLWSHQHIRSRNVNILRTLRISGQMQQTDRIKHIQSEGRWRSLRNSTDWSFSL